MNKAKFLLPLIFGILSVILTTVIVAQSYDAPEPYLPPHPYPEPGWSEFPEPGDTVRYYMNGRTVDDVRAEIMNLHGSDFQDEMQQVRFEAQQVLQQQQQTNAAWEQAFPQVKVYAQEVVNQIECKLNEKIAQLEKEAAEMEKYNIPTTGEDEAIAYINNIVKPLINTLRSQVDSATSTEQLKNILQNTQRLIDDNDTQWKSVASNVMASRILRFKYCVQTLVDYGNEIVNAVIKQMEASFTEDHATKMTAGLKQAYPNHREINYKKADYIRKYQEYITNDNSRFNNDWKEAAALYDEASQILSTCDGTNSCIIPAKEVMEEAKYILQDMFHTFWWAYDWYKYAIEPTGPVNWKPDENLVAQYISQGLPDMPCQWMQHSGCVQTDPNDICDAGDAPEWWPTSVCQMRNKERLINPSNKPTSRPGATGLWNPPTTRPMPSFTPMLPRR